MQPNLGQESHVLQNSNTATEPVNALLPIQPQRLNLRARKAQRQRPLEVIDGQVQNGQTRKHVGAEEIRQSASDIGRVGREVLKLRSVSESQRDLPGLKGVVVDLHRLELRHAGEEVGGDGGETVIAGNKHTEVGQAVKRGNGTRDVVVLQLQLFQPGQVLKSCRESALEIEAPDLDPGNPFILRAPDVVPHAWVRAGPPRRVEAVLESQHY